MALDPELLDALNAQTTLEMASAYQYLALADNGTRILLEEILQSEEEQGHAMRFFDYILAREATVRLGAIPAPEADFSSPLEAFERALAGERTVTAAINDLYALATDKRDYASYPLLDWFVNEQVEEEATVTQIIDDLRRAGNEGHALLMLDRELGARSSTE